MMRPVLAAATAALLMAGASALAQPAPTAPATVAPAAPAPPAPDFTKVTIKTTDLGHRTWMLEGLGGNITVAAADDGVLMVDSQFAPLHDKIKAAVGAVSDQPIRFVINTHYHGDHTGGDAGFAKDGAQIVAQINVRRRLAEGTVNGLTGAKTPPAPPEALPSRSFDNALTITLKGRAAILRHIPAAHTDGDTYVWFPDAKVLATGDIVSVGNRYPNVDVANGGNIKGMIAGVDAFLALADADTRIVPGHGPMMDKAALADYRATLVQARDLVAAQIAKGMSEDAAVAAKPLAALDAKTGASPQGSANFVRLIYRSLKPG